MVNRERYVVAVTEILGITKGDPDLTAISLKARVTTVSLTYVDLVKWTVTTGKKGIPKEISLATITAPTKLHFRVEIDGVEQWKDELLLGNLTIPIAPAEITTDITVQILSTDGTSVAADGAISGGEY